MFGIMSQIRIVDPKQLTRPRKPARDLHSKRVRGTNGKFETIYVLDTSDADFRQQFETVFQLNVTRARRGRKQRAGVVAAE